MRLDEFQFVLIDKEGRNEVNKKIEEDRKSDFVNILSEMINDGWIESVISHIENNNVYIIDKNISLEWT